MPATVTIIFGGQEQQTFALEKPSTVVGRDPTCDIQIDNLGISRNHCQFLRRGSAYVVQDMNSSNGTFVNGKRIAEHYLNDQDEVVIGKYTLKFRNDEQAAQAQAAEKKEVPDTLNTYVMDGAKIQEQLARMRGQTAPAPGRPAGPMTARDFAKAMDGVAPPSAAAAAKVQLYQTLFAISFIVNILLVTLLIMKVAGVF
ncbi:MAG: FHA domain-containing protein [Planctomycetota bacterium]|nr:FHA domain-containing protein [Planctomycetota bacterium]